MTPRIAQRGTSFKGASQYYLHDKREAGEAVRTTSERVDWTTTRNIATDNAEFAFRVMAHTAMDKDRLKEQAGIKNTGRKSKGDVYAYSLAWHPDEKGKYDKAQMLDVADQSLKALGAQDHQAVIIAHNDTDHPHVHVVVNLVHPDTGKNLSLSNDRKKLDKWANEYRKGQGVEHKYNPNRAKKYEAIDARKKGQSVDFISGDNQPRGLKDDVQQVERHASKEDTRHFKKQSAKDYAQETISVTVNGRVENLNLSQYGAYLKTRHRQQWHELKTNHANKKKQISRDYYQQKDRAIDAIKSQHKSAFTKVYRDHHNRKKQWEKRDKRLIGKLQNAIETVKLTKTLGRPENEHFAKSLFNALVKTGSRQNALDNLLKKDLASVSASQSKQIKDAVRMLNSDRKGRMSDARQNINLQYQLLKDAQQAERKELQGRWQRLNRRRQEAVKQLVTRGRVDNKRDEDLLPDSDKITAKEQFKRAQEEKRTRARSRSRKREQDE